MSELNNFFAGLLSVTQGPFVLIRMHHYHFLLGCCHAWTQFGQASKTGGSGIGEPSFYLVSGSRGQGEAAYSDSERFGHKESMF